MMLRALLALLLLALPATLRAQEPAPAPVVITGVVLEHDTGYPPGVLTEDWQQWFKLIAWRKDDGPIETTQMSVTFTAPTEEAIAAMLAQIPEGGLVRFTVSGDVTYDQNRPEARLLAVLPTPEDPKLVDTALSVLHPEPLVDPDLGTFLPGVQPHFAFSQEREWLGQKVEVVLWLDLRLADTRARTLATIGRAWEERKTLDGQARKALQRFHDLWREQYRRPGRLELTRADFARRLKLVEVSAFDNGDIGLRYVLDGVDDFPVMDFHRWNDGTIETNIP